MLSTLLILILFLAKVVVYLIILCVISLIFLRFWFEPRKGICKCKTNLHGKVALITGGNSGIGLETAKDLARRGARVIIASRDNKKSEEAVAQIKTITGNENVEYRHLNLAKKDSILLFANDFNAEFDRLDILVNNAGCGSVKIASTESGVDLLMQINYVGPFMLTNLLLDKLIASKPSRIVNVSSNAHKFAKFKVENISKCSEGHIFTRYSNTKLCDILWTKSLAKRLPDGVTANVLHPGVVKTNIFNSLNNHTKKILFLIIDLLFKSPLEGAQTIIHLCVSPNLENKTGDYYMDCKIEKPSTVAEDEDLAEEVWSKTMNLIKQ